MKVSELNGNNGEELAAATADILSRGGVAIVPTDTVYGLVCDGLNNKAKERIFSIKKRSYEKPLIGFADSLEKVREFTEIPAEEMPFIQKNWPGAATFIFKTRKVIPLITSAAGKTAFRIPRSRFILNVAKQFDVLASTSANISEEKTPYSVKEMPDSFKFMADIVIDGGRIAGRPSTIWDVTRKPACLLRGSTLFVCEGNSCRSPMAEFLLRDLLKLNPRIKTESAGIGILRCGEASPNTYEAMKEAGINLHGFISRPLTTPMLKSADLIFVMDKSQETRIILSCREAEGKITVLNIEDPIGNDIEAYRKVREILKKRIKELVLPRICT